MNGIKPNPSAFKVKIGTEDDEEEQKEEEDQSLEKDPVQLRATLAGLPSTKGTDRKPKSLVAFQDEDEEIRHSIKNILQDT